MIITIITKIPPINHPLANASKTTSCTTARSAHLRLHWLIAGSKSLAAVCQVEVMLSMFVTFRIEILDGGEETLQVVECDNR